MKAGDRVARFEVLGEVGAGGMGRVYRARDTRLGREVAIKLLAERYSGNEEYLLRFEHEARAASALNHPNIVTVYDIGEEGEDAYIVMEYVEGRPLSRVIPCHNWAASRYMRTATASSPRRMGTR